MAWKTSPNTNLYLIEADSNGLWPVNPALQALRWVSSSLEGSYETIANDTKLPGRNPSKDFKGTDQNAGDLVANFAGLEHDKLLAAVLCSEDGFVKNDALSVDGKEVFDMVPGNKQRMFALLKEYTQDPKLYQFFRGLQFNTLNISFTISALVKLTFGLMGANNPELEDAPPVSMANKLPALTTEEFITLQGAWKFKGPEDAEPEEYIDGVSITLDITNNMEQLKGLFQKEAIDKTLGMLGITGTINEYVKDGKLYNLAKRGEGGELHITVFSDKDDIKYEFILNISFDNSTLSGDPQLQYALPFKTYGEGRFLLRKTVKADEPAPSPDPDPDPDPDPTPDPDPDPDPDPTPAPVPVTGVSLDVDTLELEEGDTEQLIATVAPADADNKSVTWESDDADVATVDQSGNVLAIAEGTATITVTTADGGFTADCEVTVTEA